MAVDDQLPIAGELTALPVPSSDTISDSGPVGVGATDQSGSLSTTDLITDLSTKASGELTDQQQSAGELEDKEKVWLEINQAISSLNDMVGSEMFRELHRASDSRMEVRLDAGYWRRVMYQTRVDLKNDISNIWHLYVRQYNGYNESSVYFVDDITGKTIDIFSRAEAARSTTVGQ